jgi:hypothetical protein
MKVAAIIFIFTFAFVAVLPAIAQEPIVQCGNGVDDICDYSDVESTVSRMVNFALLYVAVPASVIVIIWGGFEMIFSAGNESKFKAGRQKIQNVAIALLIAFGAWIIVQTVLDLLF